MNIDPESINAPVQISPRASQLTCTGPTLEITSSNNPSSISYRTGIIKGDLLFAPYNHSNTKNVRVLITRKSTHGKFIKETLEGELWLTNSSESPRSVFVTSGFTGKDKSLP